MEYRYETTNATSKGTLHKKLDYAQQRCWVLGDITVDQAATTSGLTTNAKLSLTHRSSDR